MKLNFCYFETILRLVVNDLRWKNVQILNANYNEPPPVKSLEKSLGHLKIFPYHIPIYS
jgi:hypothetical protein